MLKRLHGRLVDTLELFFNHDGCRSGCDAFRRNIDTVPCQTKNFNDSHTACKGRVNSQLQMGIIANIKCEKNRLGIPDFTFLGYSLRNRGMESWIFLHKLLLLLAFCRISCRVRNARRANNHFCEQLMSLFSPSRIKLRLSFSFHLNPSLFR